MAGVGTRTSVATVRPRPSAVGSSCWVTMPCRAIESWRAHLPLLLGRKDVDDAVDRLRGRLGMQGGEDEMASLGRGQGGGDRLQVAHLADQDHVGILSQGGAQAEGEVGRVGADLALVDDRVFVLVQELDRILDREDVVLALVVDHVDHRRQRRALARAGGAGDEDETARFGAELAQHLRHLERVQRRNVLRHQTEGCADRAALEEAVDAEASDVGDRVGEIELFAGLEAFALVVVEDAVDDLASLLAGEHVKALHMDDLALVAHRRRHPGRDVHVGGLRLDHAAQNV